MNITAKDMVSFITNRNIDPDKTFTAAAGPNYGLVVAWKLRGMNPPKWVLRYGDTKETYYSFADTAHNLFEWLIPKDLNKLDSLTIKANLIGIDKVDEATNEDGPPFYILVIRDYFGLYERTHYVINEHSLWAPREFGSIEEAQNWIDTKNSNIHDTIHNESGRGMPKYKIA